MSSRTPLSLSVSALVALVLTLTSAPAGASELPVGELDVANVAHRGASRKAPENTMSAIVQAVADHADYVGIDVRRTRDGVPVVLHDRSLRRTTNAEQVFPGRAPWNVEDFTLDQVRRLDAGDWRSVTYRGEPVPTLAAVLGELEDSPAGVSLEVKEPPRYGGADGIGRVVMQTVLDEWPHALDPDNRRFMLESFREPFLRAMLQRYPTLRVGFIGRADAPRLHDFSFGDKRNVRADTVTRAYVETAHEHGVAVSAWTVDSASWMRRLIDLGVDVIATNRPEVLRRVLASEGLTEAPFSQQRTAVEPAWNVQVRSSARRGSRVRVAARLTDVDGTPLRWRWAAVQSRTDGRWRTLQLRATDSNGRFRTTVAVRRGVRIRVRTVGEGEYPAARSAPRDVRVRRVDSRITLRGEHRIRRGQRARLVVRWHADGRALTGSAKLMRRRHHRWHKVRTFRVRHGSRVLHVRPRHNAVYAVRGSSGWWYRGDADRHRVRVRRRR